MTEELIIARNGELGTLSLNRPQAIHALTLPMVRAMTAALLAWRDDPEVKTVVIDHAEGRGFCSGGDINLLRHSVLNDHGQTGRVFFYEEYQLNHLIFAYPKPVVAFMDGITMGGGVGICQPARFHVATENTRFAMPETGIGLFPDVGGGWYLSRLPGRIGQFLALTGARFDGADCHWAGLATHYLPSDVLSEAKARLARGYAAAEVLAALAITPPVARIAEHAARIVRHFASDRLETILDSLTADDSEWATRELALVRAKSPQACKVALRQLHDGLLCADFAANMAMEYRIVSRVLTMPDFAEGVRAVIVDKDNAPRWDPATPEAVSHDLIDSIFAALPPDEEWRPL
ncbi:enoyl-CoA hydratase/isomerase family protein [Novosphingobium sp. AAP93]|uniref:enoyl-CoA hydratase/isomerase family protein n=1 Tax=Novosphingobium sp. AAP93 TaxID=1523427 RepID=UPI0006B8BA8A|nr:enoyl-CoA hydratase/isomerase family protein [Novosphingobium sp. AAP93]KPF79307.1 enoyl-CoA hydratase [Novosphingobium sp. AAP93]